jgi:hypothetical protein
MLSSVEAWWAGLCALPFDGAQGDSHLFGYYLLIMSNHGQLLSRGEFDWQYIFLPNTVDYKQAQIPSFKVVILDTSYLILPPLKLFHRQNIALYRFL